MNIYNVTEFARLVGVTVKTLQRWDRQGILVAKRSPTNRRLYDDDDLKKATGRRNRSVLETEVVSNEQPATNVQ